MQILNIKNTIPTQFEINANLITYLSEKIPNINITKLLKLLYLIDENAMISYGMRITWLDYSAWKNGPVLAELYNDLKYNKPADLFQYIGTKTIGKETIILPKVKTNLDCFSRKGIRVINSIINDYKDKSASWLVNFLHKKGTQWSKTVTKNKINFEHKKTSSYLINLENLIKDKPFQETFYNAALESIEYQKDFNKCVSV